MIVTYTLPCKIFRIRNNIDTKVFSPPELNFNIVDYFPGFNFYDIRRWWTYLRCLWKCALLFAYVIRTNKMHNSCFNLIIVSSTCFERPSVHPQEDLYMQFYGTASISSTSCHRPDCLCGCMTEIPQNCKYKSSWGRTLGCFETCRKHYN